MLLSPFICQLPAECGSIICAKVYFPDVDTLVSILKAHFLRNLFERGKMSGLWGEIPTVPETDSGIAAIEREQITKPRPMEVEGPPLHQPSSRHHPPTNE